MIEPDRLCRGISAKRCSAAPGKHSTTPRGSPARSTWCRSRVYSKQRYCDPVVAHGPRRPRRREEVQKRPVCSGVKMVIHTISIYCGSGDHRPRLSEDLHHHLRRISLSNYTIAMWHLSAFATSGMRRPRPHDVLAPKSASRPSPSFWGAAPLLPLAGEGGAKRRMRAFFQRVARVTGPHPSPLPQAGEGAAAPAYSAIPVSSIRVACATSACRIRASPTRNVSIPAFASRRQSP